MVRRQVFDEGCRVTGAVQVPRVPGAIRFEARPFSDADSLNLDLLNVTHKVHYFIFGPQGSEKSDVLTSSGSPRINLYKNIAQNVPPDTLTDTTFPITSFGQTSHHFLQVIPTLTPQGYFYQATHKHQPMRRNVKNSREHLERGVGRQFPSASFTYELSPIEVNIQPPKRRWYDLIVGLLGNIGGTVSMISLINYMGTSLFS